MSFIIDFTQCFDKPNCLINFPNNCNAIFHFTMPKFLFYSRLLLIQELKLFISSEKSELHLPSSLYTCLLSPARVLYRCIELREHLCYIVCNINYSCTVEHQLDVILLSNCSLCTLISSILICSKQL